MDVIDTMPSGLRASCTAPRPKRIDGISVEVVPFQLNRRKSGMKVGKWMPELKITGLIAETIPAQMAAAGRLTPKTTTAASHSNPVVAVTVKLFTVPWYDTYRTPPSPAIAAEIAKMPIFTRNTDTPEAVAAISDERVAAIARPHEDRFRL